MNDQAQERRTAPKGDGSWSRARHTECLKSLVGGGQSASALPQVALLSLHVSHWFSAVSASATSGGPRAAASAVTAVATNFWSIVCPYIPAFWQRGASPWRTSAAQASASALLFPSQPLDWPRAFHRSRAPALPDFFSVAHRPRAGGDGEGVGVLSERERAHDSHSAQRRLRFARGAVGITLCVDGGTRLTEKAIHSDSARCSSAMFLLRNPYQKPLTP